MLKENGWVQPFFDCTCSGVLENFPPNKMVARVETSPAACGASSSSVQIGGKPWVANFQIKVHCCFSLPLKSGAPPR
jgi:hypothetical protein